MKMVLDNHFVQYWMWIIPENSVVGATLKIHKI